MNIILGLVLFLAICAGLILLQIFLCKKESKWPGLILPIISFCVALLAVFNIAAYTMIVVEETQVMDENGVVTQLTEPAASGELRPINNTRDLLVMVVAVFFLYNIPTLVLLAIYFACREKFRRRKALERMQAQDLF